MKVAVPTLRRCRALRANRECNARTHDAHAVHALRKTGVTILEQRDNGRRTVVVIDHPPAFVRGGLRRRERMPDGRTACTFAAPWRGLQLEWIEAEEARHADQ